jgi:LemA protein
MGRVVILIVLFILLLFGIGLYTGYNGFVTADADVKAQIGNLNSVYQMRADLVPNLVETVKGAAGAEQQTLTEVISARSQATKIQLTPEALKDPAALQKFQTAQGELGGALSRLMVVSEKYPELRSQANFPILLDQLQGLEARIRNERNKYNEVVRDFDVRVRKFPSNMVAGMFGFTVYPEFTASEGAENAPKVDFNGGKPATAPSTGGQAPATAPSQTPHGALRPAPVH